MALQYVGGIAGADVVNGYTVSLSGTLTGGIASSPAAGDIVVVASGFGNTASSAPAVTGNNSGAYTGAGAALHVNDTWDTEFRLFYMVQGATPDTTLTITRTNNAAYGGATVVQVWRGVDTTTPIDVTGTPASTTNGSRGNPPAITPVTSGAVVIAAGAGTQGTGGSAFTVPSGMTNAVTTFSDGTTSDIGVWIASATWTSGSYDPPAWTGGATSTSSSAAAQTIALRPWVAQNVNPDLLSGSETLYDPTLSQTGGSQTVDAVLLTNTETLYAPTVSQTGGTQTVTPDLLSDGDSLYNPALTATYTATANLLTNSSTIYGPTLTSTYALVPALLTNTQTLYSPSVSITRVYVTPSLLTNASSIYGPTITAANDIVPALLTNTQSFFGPTVSQGSQTIRPNLVTDTGGAGVAASRAVRDFVMAFAA